MISFDVVGLEGSNKLHWETAEEIASDYFEVMRSRNATTFTIAGVLKSASLGKAETTKYEYQDRTAGRGTTYYRLKQVDKNGEYSLSRIISVQNEKALNSFLYPNPASTHLMVAADLGYYKIINTKGGMVREGVGRVNEHIIWQNFLQAFIRLLSIPDRTDL